MPRNLGTALGLMNGVAFGLGSLGVALIGLVVTRSGPDAALILVAFAPLLAAVAYAVVGTRRAADHAPRDRSEGPRRPANDSTVRRTP